MAVYQDKAKARIKEGLRKTLGVVKKAKKSNTGEADTRTIVFETLTQLLGWDSYDNITAEYAIKGGFADYAIQKTDSKGRKKVYAVIEIKPVGRKLNEQHLKQARDYAINEGVKWVIVTNGDDWNVYRVVFNKRANIPETFHIFFVSVSDTETKPADRAELLYLLSEEASRKNELDAYYDIMQALSGENLVKIMLTKEVIDRIRLAVKKETGINFPNDEIAEVLLERVVDENSKPTNCSYYVKKLGK